MIITILIKIRDIIKFIFSLPGKLIQLIKKMLEKIKEFCLWVKKLFLSLWSFVKWAFNIPKRIYVFLFVPKDKRDKRKK